MPLHMHIRNLLEIIASEKSVRRFYCALGSPQDKDIKAAQRALIEYHKTHKVTDADVEQEGGAIQRTTEKREGHDGTGVDTVPELQTHEVRSTNQEDGSSTT